MSEEFSKVLEWLEAERETYQTRKFDYPKEASKPVEYWVQQFDSYIQRLPVFGLDTMQGFQAALKLAATAVALCEHMAERQPMPSPGVSSGDLSEWTNQ